MKYTLKLIFVLVLGLFGSSAVASESIGECQGVFTGVLNSHDDNGEITLQPNVEIYGTIDHKVTTKSLTAQPGAECDGADCLKTNTIVDKFNFDVLLSDGSIDFTNVSTKKISFINPFQTFISGVTTKEYKSFSVDGHSELTINGDYIIKVQDDFELETHSTLNINGDVTIYAKKFDMGSLSNINLEGHLTIITSDDVNIQPQGDNNSLLTILSKKDVTIKPNGNLKVLIYAGNDVDVSPGGTLFGSITAKNINIQPLAIVNYDEGLVNDSCDVPNESDCNQNITIIDNRVSSDNDDAEESSSGSIYRDSSDLELMDGQGGVGIRFQGLRIPKNSTITKAYIQFSVDEVDERNSETTNLIIRGEDVDSANFFSENEYDISSRKKTSTSASWSPPAWRTKHEAGVDQQTSDLTALVQEIVNREGWNSENNMAFIITGNGKRVAESFNGESDKAPLLHIEFNSCYNDDYTEEDNNSASTAMCYALPDNSSTLYKVLMNPDANPLPYPETLNISKIFDGEGSAYRASNDSLYAFDEHSSSSDLYTINLTTGSVTEVKSSLLNGSVEGAEFYYDPTQNKEILYVTSEESRSKLYAFYADSWLPLTGYPKNVHGSTTSIDSLAINPVTGKAYASDDYEYDGISPNIHEINLQTGETTFKIQVQGSIDAEGLAYASDGNLYVEDENHFNSNGRKIYKIDLTTGVLTPSALLGGSGDVEGISCNGTQIAIDYPTIKIDSHSAVLEGNTSTTDLRFLVTLNKPAVADITLSYAITDVNTTVGEDYITESNLTIFIPKDSNSSTITISIKGDTKIEGDERLLVSLVDATNAVIDTSSMVGTIINDDNDDNKSQPLGCVENALMFQNKPTDISFLDLASGDMNVKKEDLSLDNINAAGYNKKDGYYWGYNTISRDGTLSRVGQDSEGTLIYDNFNISNLYVTNSYIGDINNDGHLYLYQNQKVSVVNLDPDSTTYLTEIKHFELNENISMLDWGFNPQDDKLYAVNSGDSPHYLYKIEPSNGEIISRQDINLIGNHALGAGFFDKNGFYYIYSNATGKIFRIDVNAQEPEAVPFSTGGTVSLNDGAMCSDIEIRFDFGDAPYATLLADDGARHRIKTSEGETHYLGDDVSTENEGKPSIDASSDEYDDGVKVGAVTLQGFEMISKESLSSLTIKTHGDGYLNAWIDWNRDGDFNASEQIAKGVDGSSGTINLTLNADAIPSIYFNGEPIYARFRYSSVEELNATGSAPDGEVEDYRMNTANYPSLRIDDVTKVEGNENTTNFIFTVSVHKSAGQILNMSQATGFFFRVIDGTATLTDNDYTLPAQMGEFIVKPNDTAFTITVPVIGDKKIESSENFTVELYSPSLLNIQKNVGVGTIINDDSPDLNIERINSDSVDNASPVQRKSLYTKIAGRDFNYAIVSYSGDEPYPINDTTIKVELIDNNSTQPNDVIYGSRYIYLGDENHRFNIVEKSDLAVDRVTRNARFIVSYLLDENGSMLSGEYDNSDDYHAIKALNGNVERTNGSDDFAIKPAGYRMKIEDKDDSNKTITYRTNDTPSTQELNLAAEYPYELNVQAVIGDDTHTIATHYKVINSKELNVTLTFDNTDTTSCADTNTSTIKNYNFNNGQLKEELSHDNVGKYTLHIEDINWTSMDKNEEKLGCILDSHSNTADATGKFGCNIASNEGNNFHDMEMTFQAYKFEFKDTNMSNINGNEKDYLYMSDLTKSKNMGVNFHTTLEAKGKNSTLLTNFTKGCVAKDIQLSLEFAVEADTGSYTSSERFALYSTGGTMVMPQNRIILNSEDNESVAPFSLAPFNNITVPADSFVDNNKGLVVFDILYNMQKNLDDTTNPIGVNFIALDANATDGKAKIKGVLETPNGRADINKTSIYYFARIASLTDVYSQTDKRSVDTPISVEIFCQDRNNSNQSWCTDTMEMNSTARYINQKTDRGWYTAIEHNGATDGKVYELKNVSDNSDIISTNYTTSIPPFINGEISSIKTQYILSGEVEGENIAEIAIDSDVWLRFNKRAIVGMPLGTSSYSVFIKGSSSTTGEGKGGLMFKSPKKVEHNGKMSW